MLGRNHSAAETWRSLRGCRSRTAGSCHAVQGSSFCFCRASHSRKFESIRSFRDRNSLLEQLCCRSGCHARRVLSHPLLFLSAHLRSLQVRSMHAYYGAAAFARGRCPGCFVRTCSPFPTFVSLVLPPFVSAGARHRRLRMEAPNCASRSESDGCVHAATSKHYCLSFKPCSRHRKASSRLVLELCGAVLTG